MVEPTTDQVQPKLDPSMGQEQAEHGSSRSPLNPLIPDTGYLNADTGYLIAEEAREDAPPPPPDDAPSADVVETAEILVKAPWVGDDLPDVIRQVARSFELVDGFQPRDGPLEAEGYAMWRGYRKKPPSNWYQAWLNWIKRARKDATTNRRNGSGRYSDPAAEEPVEFVGVRRRIVDR